ncbi:hypothetical protein G6F68_018227 [Rhizopus microsporus]|nr:hypothetical protein G6F68_018227 [Rhizopus microsporus]
MMQRRQGNAIGLHHLAQVDEILEVLRRTVAHLDVVQQAAVALAGHEFLVRADHRAVDALLGAGRDLVHGRHRRPRLQSVLGHEAWGLAQCLSPRVESLAFSSRSLLGELDQYGTPSPSSPTTWRRSLPNRST